MSFYSIKPQGDDVILQCFYKTKETGASTPVLVGYLCLVSFSKAKNILLPMQGGDSTREEMCLVFLYYYPLTNMTSCGSFPYYKAYSTFAEKYVKYVQITENITCMHSHIYTPCMCVHTHIVHIHTHTRTHTHTHTHIHSHLTISSEFSP